MTIPIHRHTDSRTCGATTIVSGQSTVFANNLLVSVDGDPNSDGGGALAAVCNQVFAHNIMVVNHTPDTAAADALCLPLGGNHCGPATASGSGNVFVGDESQGASEIEPDEATGEFYELIYSPYKQPGVSSYDHAVTETDDEGAPSDIDIPHVACPDDVPECKQLVPLSRKQTYVANSAKEENVDIKTPPTMEPPATIPDTPPVSASGYNYDDITSATSFSDSFRLSPSFTLGMLTTRCAVSHYTLRSQVTSGRMYSDKEIVRNLRDLCYNILEPLKQMYPSMVINSGFRHGGGKSQHERGQAADVAIPSVSSSGSAAWPIAQNIAASNLPYDQFIFEQNRTIWFHLSYDRSKSKQRRMVMTKPRGIDRPTPGLRQVV